MAAAHSGDLVMALLFRPLLRQLSCLLLVATHGLTTGIAAGQELPQKPVEKQPSGRPPITSSETLIVLPNCHVSSRETVEIPALERGALQQIIVEPGTDVTAGQVLGRLDDAEANLAVELARQDLQVAEQKLLAARTVPIAAAAVEEAKQFARQTQADALAAQAEAADDTAVRLAEKAAALARDVVERRRVSRSLSQSSISEMEWFNSQNALEQAEIRLESAQRERELASMRSQSKQAAWEQQQASVQRLTLLLEQAQGTEQTDKLALENLRTALRIAETRLQRRQLRAPFDAVIVDQLRYPGEWVEVGESVLVVMRRDRLTVEGFVRPAQSAAIKSGMAVRFVRPDDKSGTAGHGRVVFVSPAIDAVNQNVRVRAAVDHTRSSLRAGEIVEMQIGEMAKVAGE